MNQPAPLLLAFMAALLPALAAEPVSFSRDVLPILSDNCFSCHGNDASHRKAKLRLDIREEALKKEAFVPGKAEASELVKRLFLTDPDEMMPPPESHKKLTPEQKELLKRWVAEGAKYQNHWSYDAPSKAAVPSTDKAIDTLIAVDSASGKVAKTLALASPQGLAISNSAQLWVGSDAGGNLSCVDRGDFLPRNVFHFTDDTDDIHLDARTGSLYVSSGDEATGGVRGGQAMIVEVWPDVPRVHAHNFFPAHVEGFALVPDTPFIVASTPDVNQVHVLDRTTHKITATWPVPAPLADVTPLLFDNATQTVVAVARTPGALVVFDFTAGGKVLTQVPCECGDADDVWLDAASKTVLVSSGAAGDYTVAVTRP
jgi:hypothetical protein